MGYIELKTGQVALRPKSGVTPVRPDWKTVILPESRSWRGIAYGAGKFILADSNVGLYSADGINWTKTTLPSDISDIAYGNNRFVVVGSAKTSYSTDGLTWNTTEQSKSYTWVSFANDRFLRAMITVRHLLIILPMELLGRLLQSEALKHFGVR